MDDNDQGSFWSSILTSLKDLEPKLDDHFYPEINSPIMVMSTSMAIDATPPPEPSNATIHEDMMEAEPEKTTANNNEIEAEAVEDAAVEESRDLGKRPHDAAKEARNMAEKRKRAIIRSKIQKLYELIPSCKNHKTKDLLSTLECIVDSFREMQNQVEALKMQQRYRMQGPMWPQGMGLDYPRPWFAYMPPQSFMPFNGYTNWQSSCYNHQMLPFTTPQVYNYNQLQPQSQPQPQLQLQPQSQSQSQSQPQSQSQSQPKP